MNSRVHRSAEDRRREIRENANRIGVDDAYISRLVDEFYDRIRSDPVLGPIFEAEIRDQWPSHLANMKDFWASVALNAGRYSGQPAPAHKRLTSVRPADFERWLSLFRETLEATAPTAEAAAYFMTRAERIASSLQMAMFPMPGLPADGS